MSLSSKLPSVPDGGESLTLNWDSAGVFDFLRGVGMLTSLMHSVCLLHCEVSQFVSMGVKVNAMISGDEVLLENLFMANAEGVSDE